MQLHYLDFDVSEQSDGSAVFDAMASVASAQLPALWAEVAAVLDWAHAAFAQGCAPLEDGGEWDFLLEGAQEVRTPVELVYDRHAHTIAPVVGTPGPARHSLSLSLTGTAGFAEAFRETFGI